MYVCMYVCVCCVCECVCRLLAGAHLFAPPPCPAPSLPLITLVLARQCGDHFTFCCACSYEHVHVHDMRKVRCVCGVYECECGMRFTRPDTGSPRGLRTRPTRPGTTSGFAAPGTCHNKRQLRLRDSLQPLLCTEARNTSVRFQSIPCPRAFDCVYVHGPLEESSNQAPLVQRLVIAPHDINLIRSKSVVVDEGGRAQWNKGVGSMGGVGGK